MALKLAIVAATSFLSVAGRAYQISNNLDYLTHEVNYVAGLKSRLTGSPKHNQLIDHIQRELESLGLDVETDYLDFTYYDGPHTPPQLSVQDLDIPVTSWIVYSGFTNSSGVSGELVNLFTSSSLEVPDWKKASGKVAVSNITNVPQLLPSELRVWPGSPDWDVEYGSPEANAEIYVRNLTDAANAGVKGIIYAWQNASVGLVEGQYSPFHNLYQGVPSVFVQGDQSIGALLDGAQSGSHAKIVLEASMVPKTRTRSIYVVFEGTDLKNESMLINTHTDGLNAVEENGYIALLIKAQDLVAHPPRRTTVLIFVTGHMHYEAFAAAPGKATTRWLNDHPEYWAGQGQSHALQYGGQLQAVAASCVEHLAAVHWDESVAENLYFPTTAQEPELLYAATPELDNLLRQYWRGADPNITRVTNPVDSAIPQVGEGYPWFLANIPNFSLVTDPSYLLKIWPDSFNETQLVDLPAMQRQIESFLTIWRLMDNMPAGAFGSMVTNGTQKPLQI